MNKLLKNAMEWGAMVAAILCVIDCTVLPVVVALSPLLGLHEITHGINDQLTTLIVVVLCLVAFFPGFLKHRNLKVAALAATGIFFVLFANVVSDHTDKLIHVLLCITGSACIIRANWLSRKLLSARCCEHH